MPYVVTTRTPATFARSRSAADVAAPPTRTPSNERSARIPGRVVEQPGQLGRDHRCVAPLRPAGHPLSHLGEPPGVEPAVEVEDLRRGPRHDRPDQDLEPRHVMRRHRQQPATRAAEHLVGGRRGRDQALGRQHRALRGTRGPRGPDHDRHAVRNLLRHLRHLRRRSRLTIGHGLQRVAAGQRPLEVAEDREDRRTVRDGQAPQSGHAPMLRVGPRPQPARTDGSGYATRHAHRPVA